jgi:3-oxoacyl-(acyl-carrier-protein) synthase/NAD(P)-dependent dehydrogenase (short-subunit alcohol dehydrogenase family)/acyl carrier protein
MASLSIEDAGLMVAVSGPLETVEEIVAGVDGNVVVANVNSTTQCVIGGATPAVQEAEKVCRDRGLSTARLPVSHAFHTSIVAPASEPLRKTLERLDLRPPVVPIISNVTGDFYPSGPDVVPEMLDLLALQVASPVQFVKGLRRLADAGATVFVEVGPKWALRGFASDVLGGERGGASMSFLASNHPKVGDIVSFNQALCGLYAAGLGEGRGDGGEKVRVGAVASPAAVAASASAHVGADEDVYVELGHVFADFLERGRAIYESGAARPGAARQPGASRPPEDLEPVVITGAAIGTPGTAHIFDDLNIGRLLNGTQFIDVIPTRIRNEMLDHHITRLVKSEDGAFFETIDNPNDVIKLAARAGEFDLSAEFGLDPDRVAAYGRTTRLAVAAGLDALRDAGIPMMMRYKTTHLGTKLPERWGLPDALRDDTGVIFASAFPGFEEFAAESSAFATDRTRHEEMSELEAIRSRVEDVPGADVARDEIDRRLHDLRKLTEDDPYHFDRRFLFHVLSMGHSQFADVIGARGPNTQINAACASTAQAVAIAHDWIRAGRCRRVVVVAGDDVTSDRMLGWFGSGFLAAGAAATDEDVTAAALPFDRRRHGMLLGMGAAAIVVEEATSARERGLRPICEVLGAETANSAFHGTRLDVDHIGDVMERLVAGVESRTGLDRRGIAPETVFVSHETYTPARGGSASAEIFALRRVFGEDADKIVIANTKGFTGHPMAVGLEDVVAVKTLETGIVPPVANYREPDPELGQLNLSKGGTYPVEYALRLAAGFGSQIAMLLLKHTPPPGGHRPAVDELGFGRRIFDQAQFDAWLALVSGRPEPRLEVAHRQLRLVDDGPPETLSVTPASQVAARPAEQPVTVVAPPAAVATGGAKAAADDPVPDRIVALVSEQTGYPADMLALDLDLEADLGIDTVKQAELFARIREEYGIERDENLRLRDYPTLNHVVGFVRERSSVLPAARVAAAPPEPSARPATETATSAVTVSGERAGAPGGGTPGGDPVPDRIVALVSEQTGYPADMLALDLDLEADLGIDTVKQAELFARIREEYGIERDEDLRLRDYPTLNHVVGFVHERAAALEEVAETESPAVDTEAGASLEDAGPTGAEDKRFPRRVPLPILLPPLEACRPTGISFAGARVVVVADSSGVAPRVVERLEKEGAETLVIDAGPSEASVLKSLNAWREKGHVTGVFWLPAIDDEGALADMDADAWREGLRIRVKLLAATMRELYGDISGAGTFLLSATRLGGQHGYGSGGATAPMGGAVTGFTKAYAREQPDVLVKAVDFATTEDAAEISERLLAEALRDPSTVEVGYAGSRRWSVALAEQPAVDGGPEHALTADSVLVVSGAAGSIVSAVICDLARCKGTFHLLDRVPEPNETDPDLERFVADRTGLKRDIAARLEAAGERATPATIDRKLAGLERERAAVDAMAAVRAAGGTVLWHQVDLTDHTAVAQVMKTITKAHPRVDVLLHCAGVEKSHMLDSKPPEEFDLVFDVKSDGWFNLLQGLGAHPLGTAAVFSSIAGRFGNGGQTDYSAANDLCCKVVSSLRSTRPETRGVAIDWTAWASIGMASRGSIPQMMELAGIEMLPPEVGVPIVRREITAGGPGGEVVAAGRLGTMAPETSGSDSIEPAPTSAVLPKGAGPMLGQVVAWGSSHGLTVETELDPTRQLFLDHHRIDGTAVLPGVMGVEAFAEAASASAPGWTVAAIEDVEFQAPFKFFRDEPRTFAISVTPLLEGAGLKVDCRLVASRSLADGSEQFVTHFTGRVGLVEGSLPAATTEAPVAPAGPRVDPAAIYAVYFHGPAYRVLDLAGRVGDRMIGRFAEGLPLSHEPATANLVLEPRLLELCFQTAGILELGETGRLALPQRVGRVQLFTVKNKVGRWYAAVTPRVDGRGVDAVVADEAGHVCMSVEAYETIALPGGVTNHLVEPLRLASQ